MSAVSARTIRSRRDERVADFSATLFRDVALLITRLWNLDVTAAENDRRGRQACERCARRNLISGGGQIETELVGAFARRAVVFGVPREREVAERGAIHAVS